jgi:DNA-binding transcriptional LysR family regulator
MNWQDRAGRRISLRHLHILMAVVQFGSIAKAAAALSVSHPVVSKTISDLEHVLGVRLIERGKHGVEPTAYGRACLDCGTAVFDDLRQGIQRIVSLSDPATGEVRVGAADPMMQDVIPTIVERIARKYPKMVFHLKSAYAEELHHMLRERRVDLVITRRFSRLETDLLSEPFITEKLFVVCGSNSPWAKRRTVKLADLLDEPWVLPDSDNIIAPFVVAAFRAAGFDPPKPKVVANALDVRARFAANGNFLTIVPGSTLYRSSGGHPLKKLPVLGSINSTPTEIVTLKNRIPAPAAILFLEFLRSSAKAMSKAIAAADTAA